MKRLLLIVLVSILPLAAFAASGTAIPGGLQSTPYLITKPGAYYLAANRVMTTPNVWGAIQVQADNVTLDLNGYSVGFDTTEGISGGHAITVDGVSNVEIRNGTISTAPGRAIKASEADYLRVIDVRTFDTAGIESTGESSLFDRCHISDSRILGMHVTGWGSIIRDCTVARVFGSGSGGVGIHIGIFCTIKDSSIYATEASGISCSSRGATIENCTIANANMKKHPTDAGLYLAGSAARVRGNHISGANGSGIRIVSDWSIGNILEENAVSGTRGASPAAGAAIVSLNATTVLRGNAGTDNDGPFIAGQHLDGGNNLGN